MFSPREGTKLYNMIDRIEFHHLPGNTIAIAFYYDTDCMDVFTVFEPAHINQLMSLIATEPDPGCVLVALRDFGRFSLH